jgi:spermidine synthase
VLALLVLALPWGAKMASVESTLLNMGLISSLLIVLCFSFRHRPIRFGLGIGAVLLATGFHPGDTGRVLHTQRSFFGVHRVMVDAKQKYVLLIHGRTSHGQQSLDPSRRNEPLSYYYPTGPMGQVFKVSSGLHPNGAVAIIGLGTGSMACYGQAGQPFTFYEIDPVVEEIARKPEYFTFLRDCPPKIHVVLGDARLSLKEAPDRYYGLIVIDAFSSDAIPAHLATREAARLYLTKLSAGGILAFHISNRTLNLRPVFENVAWDLGLVCIARDDLEISETEQKNGKAPSQWVVMARNRNDLAELHDDPQWRLLPGRPGQPVWTDDFSNILSIIRWN